MAVDELNEVGSYKPRTIPYREYFSSMWITKAQVDERIDFATSFENFLLLIMALIKTQQTFDKFDYDFVWAELVTGYQNVIEKFKPVDEVIDEYTKTYADDFIRSTRENIDDPWFTSDDRVMFNAENEAVSIIGYKDFETAKKRGFKRKKWVTFMDKRTRKDHASLNGKTIPIDDYFRVGDAMAMFPKDLFTDESTLIDYPEQYVNCRCTIKFL